MANQKNQKTANSGITIDPKKGNANSGITIDPKKT